MKTPPTLVEAVRSIAPVILQMLQQYPELSSEMQAYYRDAICWMVRKLPICAAKASTSALEEASRLGIPTLKNFWWEHQPNYDPKRRLLHWEHVVPVGDIRDALVELQRPSLHQVEQILLAYEIAWITKAEDKKLKRSKRTDPHEEYRRAGIELRLL
jgi:hypothetical protein